MFSKNSAAAAIALAISLPVFPISVLAQSSNAARYLMNEEVSAACGGGGQISPQYFVERDLTGDGKLDLIVGHEGIRCSSGGRSGFCGAQACSIHIYVRVGALLQKKTDLLGIGLAVGDGSTPTINFHAHGGVPVAVRWNGSTFAK